MREVVSVQPVPESLAADTAPDGAGLFGRGVPEVFYAADMRLQKPLFHPYIDARQVGEFQVEQAARQIFRAQHNQPVGFLQVGCHLGQKRIGRNADGTIDRGADIAAGRNPRDVKVLLAQELVARFHSQAAAEAALADFEARFKQNAIPDELPEVTVQTGEGGVLAIASVLKEAGLVASTSEALRMIDGGGVKGLMRGMKGMMGGRGPGPGGMPFG